MRGRKMISAYTPSNTDPEILKRIFVQRERLLLRIVNRLASIAETGDMHHVLLVGPRGSGKTHFVSLVHWELMKRKELRENARIAWLGEDDTFSSLVHFAFGIAKRLADEYPDEFPQDFRSAVRGLPPDDAALAVLNSVVNRLNPRPLILITENLDRTFTSLGDIGRKKLRAFLQETRRFSILATSQQLFDAVSDRKEAFFGFFDTHHLSPLTIDDARELIRRISIEQKNSDLICYLSTAEGRYRVRSLHHLAGGNHRMYVLLAEFLTKNSLDDLVSAFEKLADDLTPFFQERLRSLPDQQGQIVQCMCDSERALTVKEISEDTFISDGTCSKQLKHLKDKGYVRSEKRGKESYYDMAEPLMRLCLDIKNQRGRPLRMVARFLKAWFPDQSLQTLLDGRVAESRTGEYLREASLLKATFDSIIAQTLQVEIKESMDRRDHTAAQELIDELRVIDRIKALLHEVSLAKEQEDLNTIIAKSSELIESAFLDPETKANALLWRAVAVGQLGQTEQEIAGYTAVIEMEGVTQSQRINALMRRSLAHSLHGHSNLALADCTAIIERKEVSAETKAIASLLRGLLHHQSGQHEQGLADCEWIIDSSEVSADLKAQAFFYRAATRLARQEVQASLADFHAALALDHVSTDIRTRALFALPEAMLYVANITDVMKALERAFREGDPKTEWYGGTSFGLVGVLVNFSAEVWPDYVKTITPLYIKYGAATKLGTSLTRTIEQFDKGGYSASQLDLWRAIWQEAGRGCEDLEIPLACLDAAVDVIKSQPKSDRALFRLPLEIRKLVRPLLSNSLGTAETA